MSDDILDSVRAERDRYKAESEQYQTEMLKRGEEIERLENDFWGIQADIKMRLAEFSEKLKEAVKYIPWCDYPPVIKCIDEIAEKLKGEPDEL